MIGRDRLTPRTKTISSGISSWIAFIVLAIFAILVVRGFGDQFFDLTCARNDLRQQGFQFYRANHPNIFANDLVYDSMRAYLPPLHFWLGLALTYPTDNPMLTAHILMSVQLLIACVGLFAAVRRLVGVVPASVSVMLFLNSRALIGLMAGGLPRGWIAPVLAVYLYLIVSSSPSQRWRVWAWLFISALLNPVATAILLLANSLVYGVRFFLGAERVTYFKRVLLPFGLLALCVVGLLWITTRRPPELGTMATLEHASGLQGFSKLGGRFPLLPLSAPWDEFQTVGLQVFTGPWRSLSNSQAAMVPVILLIVVMLLAGGVLFRLLQGRKFSELFDPELVCFGCAVAICYSLSREFAFSLYIPERYLGMPLGIFFVAFIPVLVFRLCCERGCERRGGGRTGDSELAPSKIQLLGMVALTSAVFASAGIGTRGPEMFEVCYRQRAELWDFLQTQTPPDALIAGHPTLLDGVQLFARRSGFITTETAHPFYDTYYAEVKRRIVVVFTAHYATDWRTFYKLLAPEKIDYFVFRNASFKPEALHRTVYQIPFINLLKRLNSKHLTKYVFSKLPAKIDLVNFPFLVYRSDSEAVIDVKELGVFLELSKELRK